MGKQNSTETQFFIMLRLMKANQKNFLSKLDFILEKRKIKDPHIDSKIKIIIRHKKKYRKRVVRSKKGKGSFKRKKLDT